MEGVECSEEPQSADSGKKDKKNKKKKKKKSKEKGVEEIISEVRDPSNEGSSCEEEDFWMPPVGERWDNDDGGDRWGTDSELEQEIEEGERDITGTCTGQMIFSNKRTSTLLFSLRPDVELLLILINDK